MVDNLQIDFDFQESDSVLEEAASMGAVDQPFLAWLWPKFFAEGLVPVNPGRWPAFIAGSAAGQPNIPNIEDRLTTPVDNLRVAGQYLETSSSTNQYTYRLWTISHDTAMVNGMAELGGDMGSFLSGLHSNRCAERYMEEMIDSEIGRSAMEELNLQIFRTHAQDQGRDPSQVRGTGMFCENVPSSQRELMNLGQRPNNDIRPQLTAEAGKKQPPGFMAQGGKNPIPIGGKPSSLLTSVSPAIGSRRPMWAKRHGAGLPPAGQLPGIIKAPGRSPLGYIQPFVGDTLRGGSILKRRLGYLGYIGELVGDTLSIINLIPGGRRNIFQLTKNLLTKQQYTVVQNVIISYTYYRYLRYISYKMKLYRSKVSKRLPIVKKKCFTYISNIKKKHMEKVRFQRNFKAFQNRLNLKLKSKITRRKIENKPSGLF